MAFQLPAKRAASSGVAFSKPWQQGSWFEKVDFFILELFHELTGDAGD